MSRVIRRKSKVHIQKKDYRTVCGRLDTGDFLTVYWLDNFKAFPESKRCKVCEVNAANKAQCIRLAGESDT